MNADPLAWLRWQLTQRGGLLWDETCATCAAWDPSPDGNYGGCAYQVERDMHREDACSRYESRDPAEPSD